MAFKTEHILIILGALLSGGIIGEVLRIEDRLNHIGEVLQHTFSMQGHKKFVEGFVAASLLFCVGPMAILGSIQDGLSGDYKLLGFAAALGWGVLFSTLTVLIFQGSITLSAQWIQHILDMPMINEMTATGGLIIVAIGLRLLKLKMLRVGNFLPALIIAPLLVFLVPIITRWLSLVGVR